MFFWNINGLIEYWKNKRFTDRDAFAYLFGIMVVYGIENGLSGVFFPSGSGKSDQEIDFLFRFAFIFIGTALGLVVSYYLVRILYKANGADGGNSFLNKLLSFLFVISIRVYVFMWPILLVYRLILPSGDKPRIGAEMSATSWFSAIIVLLISAVVAIVYAYLTLLYSLTKIRQFEIEGSSSPAEL